MGLRPSKEQLMATRDRARLRAGTIMVVRDAMPGRIR